MHEVENMFSVGRAPWHGLGELLDEPPTTEDAIRLAGLDWQVELKKLAVHETGEIVRHRAAVRSSDQRILGVVGPHWTPLQNVDAFKWFDPFLDAKVAHLETAGSLRNGEKVWILARLGQDPIEIVKGDAVLRYLLLSNGHDGNTAVRCGYTATRVVCANTLAVAHAEDAGKLIRVTHHQRVAATLDQIRDIMMIANRAFEATAEQYRLLAERRCNEDDLKRYVRVVFRLPDNEDVGARVLKKVIPLCEAGTGTDIRGVAGTWWSAYNGVSEFLTHERGRSRENRLDSQWFGEASRLNLRALQVAGEMAMAA